MTINDLVNDQARLDSLIEELDGAANAIGRIHCADGGTYGLPIHDKASRAALREVVVAWLKRITREKGLSSSSGRSWIGTREKTAG